jgi:hypothetical protein
MSGESVKARINPRSVGSVYNVVSTVSFSVSFLADYLFFCHRVHPEVQDVEFLYAFRAPPKKDEQGYFL